MCPCIHAVHCRALAPAHTQQSVGNGAEKCCVTGVCLRSSPRRSLQPPFIFRVFGDARKQLLCVQSKTGWEDVKEGELEEEGRRGGEDERREGGVEEGREGGRRGKKVRE